MFWSKGEARLVCHTGIEEPLCLAVKPVTAQGTSLRDNLSVQIQAVGFIRVLFYSLLSNATHQALLSRLISFKTCCMSLSPMKEVHCLVAMVPFL